MPESEETLRLLDLYAEGNVQLDLDRTAQRLEALVPGLLAFSVAAVRTGVTVTYVSARWDEEDDAFLPVAHDGRVREPLGASPDDDDPLDENHWQRGASECASAGVRSTLTLPVVESGTVVGGVDLYGRDDDTFTGLVSEIAELFGASSVGAVSNADLAFSTRDRARTAPRWLADLEALDVAARLLAAEKDVSVSHARDKMRAAAAHAGIPVVSLALMVIEDRGLR